MTDAPLAPFPTRYAPGGMVCAVDHLGAGAGVAMLRAGGSAADAAVAASAVVAVTCQHMCGMGGDLLAVVQRAGARPEALVAAGRAGSGADPERLRAAGHREMPMRGEISAVPVPGCVDGWVALHAAHGRLPLAQVLEPARRYAADGFPASPTLALSAPTVYDVAGADDFAGPLRPGSRVRRPGVARALAAIAADGRDAYYLGEFGRSLLELAPGEFDRADLEAVQAEWAEPVHAPAWGLDLWTTPPPTQGYLTPAAAWIASGLDVPADPADPLWAHLLIEAVRQASHDRAAVLHEAADGPSLVAESRLAGRRAAIAADRAAALGDGYAGGGTIGLCAVDADGTGVSLLQSNAAGWGAHIVVPGTGIFLQNRGIGFSLEPGHAAEYGPGRRPPHTLAPLLATRADGSLAAVMSSMGGDSQPMILLQLLARQVVGGEDPATAVAAGRWMLTGPIASGPRRGFSTWAAGGRASVKLERHAPAAWDEGLRRRGHDVVRGDEAFAHEYGHAHVIVTGPGLAGAAGGPSGVPAGPSADLPPGMLAGASDPRSRAGAAAGY